MNDKPVLQVLDGSRNRYTRGSKVTTMTRRSYYCDKYFSIRHLEHVGEDAATETLRFRQLLVDEELLLARARNEVHLGLGRTLLVAAPDEAVESVEDREEPLRGGDEID